MEVQRVRFLLLASALAAPACVTTVTEENPPAGNGGSSSSTGGAQNATGGKAGGTATGGASTGTGGAATGGAGGYSGYEGGDASTGGTDGSDGATKSDGAAGADGSAGDGGAKDAAVPIDANRPDGAACDDDTITGGYGNCDLLAADACTYATFQTGECTGAKTIMKPFIAQQAIECMIGFAADCDPTKTYACKDAALKIACPDPTADDECTTIHAACSTVSVDECKTYLSGMTQAGRDGMVTCLTQNCSYGLYTCVEGL